MDRRNRRRAEALAVVAVLLVAAGLRLWRLDTNGFGTTYYAAGVRSMLQGPALFFYNAFDPAGFVSLDKPPIAFWIQAAFAALLGFHGWVLLLPQALAGVGSTALVYHLVRRPFGAAAAIAAALLMALTPIVIAVDRSNNTDAWLVFFLLLAAAASLRGRGLSLVAAMALLGLAFNVKMLAALVAGPALLAGWWLASDLAWRERLPWLAGAFATLLVVSLAWVMAFDLTPADRRPYAGSSQGNSMLELIVDHNGLERFVRPAQPAPTPTPGTPRLVLYDAVPVGPLRLAHPTLAPQFAWMVPLAVLGAWFGWRRRRAPIALWSVWALAYGVVFSFAGGIFHAYYLAVVAPPLAALAGIGGFELWRRGARHLALGTAICALWQLWLGGASLGWSSAWLAAPVVALLLAGLLQWRQKRPAALPAAVALLVLPGAWALSVIFAPGNFTLPSASFVRWLGRDDGRGIVLSRSFRALTDDPRLHAFLAAQRGGARYLLAAPNALLAAPVIVRTGQPVMAFGGFLGRDPVMSVDAFARLVARGEVRFVVLSTTRREGDFERWVRAHGVVIDPAQWRSLAPEPRRAIVLYDLAAR